jgi:hypothetical protein
VQSDRSTDKERFDLWYRGPLLALDRSGGFIAMLVCCALYERFITALWKSDDPSAEELLFRTKCLCGHFGLADKHAKTFWRVMRDGLLHQGMPMSKEHLPRWYFSELPAAVVVDPETGDLLVDPLLFRDKVLDLYEGRPDLIAMSTSFPWAKIYSPGR